MKIVRNAILGLTLCSMALISCATPTPEIIEVVVTATSAPTVEAPTSAPQAPMEPIALEGPKSGEVIKWLDGGSLIYVPAGPFTMGYGGDAPVHSVSLDAYWIQQTETTNGMYSQCVQAGVCSPPTAVLGAPSYNDAGFASNPVVGVNWNQAQTYCSWIQGSLPTEAQWEKAARGTNANTYPWGEAKPSCDLLNFANCYGRTTNAVAYDAGKSSYGVFDLAGNVFEWVYDWYDANYYANGSASNPSGPQSGTYRGVRGSSFESEAAQTSSAIRRFDEPGDASRDVGFRCVVANPQPFAPYCQLTAQVSVAQTQTSTCQLPDTATVNQYCQNGDGYAVLQIPFGATWDERGTRIQCEEQVSGGLRTLVCKGPRGIESTNEVSVCNPACGNPSGIVGAIPVCDAGYTLNPSTGTCAYAPIVAQSAGACPLNYVAVQRGDQQICAVGLNANNSCPVGLYFDELAGMCVPPNGEANAPFGVDNSALAAQTYAGCAQGYIYDESSQCCQAASGSKPLSCSPGFVFDSSAAACIPVQEEALDGTGCVNARVTTLQCSVIEDTVCAPVTDEMLCVARKCSWLEKESQCVPKTPQP